MTLRLLQASLFENGAGALTCSPEASLASPQALPESAEAPPMIAGSGLTFCAWCLKSTPCGCWRKILAESLACALRDWNSGSGLRVSFRLEVTSSCPSNWLLRTLARRTEESGCGSWLTPTVNESKTDGAKSLGEWIAATQQGKRPKEVYQRLRNQAIWPSPRATDGEKGGPNQRGSKGDLMLPSAVRQWLTPTNCSTGAGHQGREGGLNLQTAVAWATPTSLDWRSTQASEATHAKNSRPLSEQVGQQDLESHNTNGKPRASLRLNPAWVSQLQGYPDGWLDVEWPPLKR